MKPAHFIGELIEVVFDQEPVLEKKPDCPNGFTWRGKPYRIVELLQEWFQFGRKGRMAKNMRPAHADRASIHGSWGVGRFFFRVKVDDGRIFELYYDRAPVDAGHRKGSWFLNSEKSE